MSVLLSVRVPSHDICKMKKNNGIVNANEAKRSHFYLYMFLFRSLLSDVITFHFIFGFALMSCNERMLYISCDHTASIFVCWWWSIKILLLWSDWEIGKAASSPQPRGKQCTARGTKMMALCDCILFHWIYFICVYHFATVQTGNCKQRAIAFVPHTHSLQWQ